MPYRPFDTEQMDPAATYRLLTAAIVPRPIAWVVTRATDGVLNCAPFSFFNMVGSDPPLLAIGLMAGANGLKHTARNILATGEMVVHMVPERLAEAMNITAVDAPDGVDELSLAGLDTVPSVKVAPPRIALAPVAIECVTFQTIQTGPRQTLVLARVVMAHFDEAYLTAGDRPRVDTPAMGLIGRMHGPLAYARTTDLFDLARPSWPPS